MAQKKSKRQSGFMLPYDPEAIRKMFDPNEVFSFFKDLGGEQIDLEALMNSSTRNFEALASANASAVEVYQDLLEKQRAIWDQMMASARETAKGLEMSGGADAATRNAKLLSDATQKAFELMQEMASSAAEANAKAFEETMKKVQETTGSPAKS